MQYPTTPPRFLTRVCDSANNCPLKEVQPAPPLPSYSTEAMGHCSNMCTAFTSDPQSCEIGAQSAVRGISAPTFNDSKKDSSAQFGYNAAMLLSGVSHNGWAYTENDAW